MLTERQRRVGELLQAQISDILLREVRDPGIHGLVTITGVEVSVDLAHARVYASIYGDAGDVAQTMAALRRASPFIRALLVRRLDIKRVPELSFHLDETAARAERIERLIRRLHLGEEATEQDAQGANDATKEQAPVTEKKEGDSPAL
ncbi:MAG: 30S ribosome-binding factor RbfA [Armatimonadetes bacterium]|nr:30S ribosome-binding factor RbfA [Armatimonadota bacterium]